MSSVYDLRGSALARLRALRSSPKPKSEAATPADVRTTAIAAVQDVFPGATVIRPETLPPRAPRDELDARLARVYPPDRWLFCVSCRHGFERTRPPEQGAESTCPACRGESPAPATPLSAQEQLAAWRNRGLDVALGDNQWDLATKPRLTRWPMPDFDTFIASLDEIRAALGASEQPKSGKI